MCFVASLSVHQSFWLPVFDTVQASLQIETILTGFFISAESYSIHRVLDEYQLSTFACANPMSGFPVVIAHIFLCDVF